MYLLLVFKNIYCKTSSAASICRVLAYMHIPLKIYDTHLFNNIYFVISQFILTAAS